MKSLKRLAFDLQTYRKIKSELPPVTYQTANAHAKANQKIYDTEKDIIEAVMQEYG